MSWKAVGGEIGLSGGVVYRVAMTNYEPRSNTIRAVLGLPELGMGEVCPVHHVVHARTCRTVPAWVSGAVDWLKAREKA